MEVGIENRLSALEERLGLSPFDDSKVDDELDVIALKKKIFELGYGFIFKIDAEVLKKLSTLTNDPKYATSAQKRATIEFGYDLMMEKIRLLKQFQNSSEVVLNSKQLISTSDLQPMLNSVKQELLEAADDVNKNAIEISNLKHNFCELVSELQSQLKAFDELVSKAEKAKVISEHPA